MKRAAPAPGKASRDPGHDPCGHRHPEESSSVRYEEALRTLTQSPLRVTRSRKAILTLFSGKHGPFSADEVHGMLADTACDLVTVYRSLASLEKIGLLRRCDFGDNTHRFELNTGEHHHHHVVCRVCHRAETLDHCAADSLEKMAASMGYSQITHIMEVFGVCARCRENASDHERH